MRSTPHSRSRRALLLLAALLILLTLPGCVTRTVRHTLIKRALIEVDLVREVKGFSVEERDYEHPAIISDLRLGHILGAVEIETDAKGKGQFRQPAFHPAIVSKTATALSEALKAAGPNEQVGMKVLRKEARLGLFNKKFLTTFLAYVDDGHLYLLLRRVDWPLTESDEMKDLPEPISDRKAMNFRVLSGDPIYYAGVQDLEIDFKSDVFRQPFRLPGSTSGEKRRREVISTSPIPKEELDESGGGSVPFDQLTPEQLRALADLEEERREGRITETAYQRARRQLLRQR